MYGPFFSILKLGPYHQPQFYSCCREPHKLFENPQYLVYFQLIKTLEGWQQVSADTLSRTAVELDGTLTCLCLGFGLRWCMTTEGSTLKEAVS